jgi:SAM-dependent methyltransferase
MKIDKATFAGLSDLVVESLKSIAKGDEAGCELEFRYRTAKVSPGNKQRPAMSAESATLDRSAFVAMLTYLRSMPHKYKAVPETISMEVNVKSGLDRGEKLRAVFNAPSRRAITSSVVDGDLHQEVLQELVARVNNAGSTGAGFPDAIQRKDALARPVDVVDYDMRCAMASEVTLTDQATRTLIATAIESKDFVARYKRRFSFVVVSTPSSTSTVGAVSGGAPKKNGSALKNGITAPELRFDLTVVRQARPPKEDAAMTMAAVMSTHETYELELEVASFERDAVEHQPGAALVPMLKQWSIALQVIGDTDYPIPNTEKLAVMAEYAALTGQHRDDCRPLGPKLVTLERGHLQKEPAPGMVSVCQEYTVTEKADGEHRLLMVGGNGLMYTIDDRMNIRFTGCKPAPAFKGSLLEGEVLKPDAKFARAKPLLLLFDAFFINGNSVGALPLMVASTTASHGGGNRTGASQSSSQSSSRLSVVDHFVKGIAKLSAPEDAAMEVRAKAFAEVTSQASLFLAAKGILAKRNAGNYDYSIDGLILTPRDLPVGADRAGADPKFFGTWKRAFKWKPPQFNTVDFLVRIRPAETQLRDDVVHNVGDLFVAYDLPFLGPITSMMFLSDNIPYNTKRKLVPQLFQPEGHEKSGAHMVLLPLDNRGRMFCEEGDEIFDDTIVEFRWAAPSAKDAKEGGGWRPLRVRHDKTQKYMRTRDIGGAANKNETALSVWNSIMEPVTEAIITGAKPLELKTSANDDLDGTAAKDVYYARSLDRFHSNTPGLRAFHNRWVKGRHLLHRFRNRAASVVDFGCGRAGDLQKWLEMGVTRVLGLDLFASNIRDPKDGAHVRALKHLRGTAAARGSPKMAFLPMDVSKVIDPGYINAMDEASGDRLVAQVMWDMVAPSAAPLAGNSNLRSFQGFARDGFDVVSCQFAVHYFFESTDTLQSFAKNVASFLRPGGYFVGTCLDGARVDAALQGTPLGSSIDGRKEGEVIWQITRMYDTLDMEDPRKNIGLKIKVYMESIGQVLTEYLVDFRTLVSSLAAVGVHPLSADECTTLLPLEQEGRAKGGSDASSKACMSTGMFQDLHAALVERVQLGGPEASDRSLVAAADMSDAEKRYSYLNRWFIFRKGV